MSQPTTNGTTNGDITPETNNNIPAWLSNATINKAVQAELGDFDKVLSVTPVANFKVGENFSSTMLRLNVEVKMLDGAIKSTTFVLKTQLTSGPMAQISEMLKLFDKEEQIYHSILPKFEKLYRDVGKEVKFAPAAYKFDRDLGVDYVLMQDLRGYKNANRCVGLDMVQMKEALKKLAEWHAASACYVEHYGMYGEEYTVGVFSEKNRDFLTAIDKSDAFLAQLKRWKNCQPYYEKLEDSDLYLVDRLLQDQKVNSREFNVLNHGDCWVNNIMFQYDAFGKIKDTLFVDFQVVKYGTPAFDLYYLILTSAQKDIKIKEFDYMIRFYYDNLVENLKLLQYHRPLPKLKNIHIQLMNFGLGAYMVVSKVLPVVMLEKTDAVMDDEVKMKAAMLTNRKYVEAMAEILPWLDNRGLLDWKQA